MQFEYPYEAYREAGIPVTGEAWRDCLYEGEDLRGVMFHECKFVNLHLKRMLFDQCLFNACRFEACSFDQCQLGRTQFASCEGSGFSVAGGGFDEAIMTESRFDWLSVHVGCRQLTVAESRVGRLNFLDEGIEQDKLTLSGCEIGRMDAGGARWRDGMAVGLDLSVCVFGDALFERTCFIRTAGGGVDLSRMSFQSCNLYQSDFSRARIRRAESSIFAECVLADTDLVSAELNGALFAKARAPNARFDGAKLRGAMFPGAMLADASFEGASAPLSVWNDADLTGANLRNLDAAQASFRHARLAGAEVDGASLTVADLHGVEETLVGADLTGARRTVEWRAELEREARG